jgi:hypothetical protein
MYVGLLNIGLALMNYAIWKEKKEGFSLFACGFCLAIGLYEIISKLTLNQ